MIKNIGHTLYRIWFYLLVALPILLLSPLFLLSTLSKKTYAQFYWLARNLWARPILFGMLLWPKVVSEQCPLSGSQVLVANHTSMIDIMLMLHLHRTPFVFVGKKELAKIPLFGFFYSRVCILVDRDSTKSRSAAYRQAYQCIRQGLAICIFPEGGVPEKHIVLDRFKDGAFRMAIKLKIPIAPLVFLDCKKRFSWEFFSGSPGMLRVKIYPPIPTETLAINDTRKLSDTVRNQMLLDLMPF